MIFDFVEFSPVSSALCESREMGTQGKEQKIEETASLQTNWDTFLEQHFSYNMMWEWNVENEDLSFVGMWGWSLEFFLWKVLSTILEENS